MTSKIRYGTVKKCTKCGIVKPCSEFYLRRRNGLHYLHSHCKACVDLEHKDWATRNPDRIKAGKKRSRAKNADKIKIAVRKYRAKTKEKWTEYGRRYRAANRERVRQWQRLGDARRRARIDFRLHDSIRVSIRESLIKKGGRSGAHHWPRHLGYGPQELKKHLESLFLTGMSWGNYGEWHIDHIIPRSYFRFDSLESPGLKACWALSNLRPLWAIDNVRKGSKLPIELGQYTNELS